MISRHVSRIYLAIYST